MKTAFQPPSQKPLSPKSTFAPAAGDRLFPRKHTRMGIDGSPCQAVDRRTGVCTQPPGIGYDFSRIPVRYSRAIQGQTPMTSVQPIPAYAGLFGESTSESLAQKKKVVTHSNPVAQGQSSGPTVRAISATGAGTVATTYTPEAKDKSTKIVFIQVMRESLDGTPVMPSVAAPAFAYQDADTTSDFYHVDYVSGEKDPYYNGDDPQDFGPQGNATSTPPVPASTSDTPNYNDASFPAG